MTQDKSWSAIIDKGDVIQNAALKSAGKFMSIQMNEAVIPEYDGYGFAKLATGASDNGNIATDALTDDNAYEMFQAGGERFGNFSVPDTNRVAFCSYKFANLLLRDPAFVKDCDTGQKMVLKGMIGEVDNTKIIRVPANRMPAGAAFLLVHPRAAIAPRQLSDAMLHQNPPGYSGWLCEGREMYDIFLLDSKANAIYYHGSQAFLKILNILTAASASGKSTILLNPARKSTSTNSWYYATNTTQATLAAANPVVFGTAITPGDWTALAASGTEITPTSTHTRVRVVEVGTDNKPVAYGDAKLNIG
jgi:hypothetical protein